AGRPRRRPAALVRAAAAVVPGAAVAGRGGLQPAGGGAAAGPAGRGGAGAGAGGGGGAARGAAHRLRGRPGRPAGPGRRAGLPPLAVQYPDYAVWQRGWLSGAVLARQLGYWRERLAGAPAALELPADRPRPPAQTFRGATESVLLPPALAAGLRALAEREG